MSDTDSIQEIAHLRTEIEIRQREMSDAIVKLAEALAENKRLTAERDELLAMLKLLEWTDYEGHPDDMACTICRRLRSEGHEQTCKVSVLLEKPKA